MVKRPPLHIMGPSLLVAAAMLVPLVYLVLRAFQADPATVVELVFRERNLWLLVNTLALTASVLILTTLIALPLAWILTRTRIAHKRLLTVLGVVPWRFPGTSWPMRCLASVGITGLRRSSSVGSCPGLMATRAPCWA